MAILSVADYQASLRQRVKIRKDGAISQAQFKWSSCFLVDSGDPGVGTFSNTTTGIVPTDATTGCPPIQDFSGTGYITGIELITELQSTNQHVGTFLLYDRLFHAGPFGAAAGTTTLGSQPSYSSRIPGGTDYKGLMIFAEVYTGVSGGSSTCHVTYTDQAGNTGHSSVGTLSKPSNVGGEALLFPMASGDCGVQTIESFVIDAASAGCQWSVVVARPLCLIRVPLMGREVRRFFDTTHMAQVWPDSALCVMSRNDGISATAKFEMNIEIASA